MNNLALEGLLPADIGLDGFKEFRQSQLEAIEQAVYGDKRIQALALPTGSGKSLVAAGIQKLMNWRTAILTSTKGLQDQYKREFEDSGLVDVRGKANYSCSGWENKSCRDGQRLNCEYWIPRSVKSECNYDGQRLKARNANWVCTNYDYWFHARTGLVKVVDETEVNPFECLVLDEGHEAAHELADYLGISVYEKEIKDLAEIDGLKTEDLMQWKMFAASALTPCRLKLKYLETLIKKGRNSKKELETAARLESLIEKFEKISSLDNDAVCEMHQSSRFGRSWSFDVVWPGKRTESLLFAGIQRVVIMSATLRPGDMAEHGLSKDDYEFNEWPRVFPLSRGPIYHYPAIREVQGKTVMVNIGRKTDENGIELWHERINEIVNYYPDVKGVIHTTSYEYQRKIAEIVEAKGRLIGNRLDGNDEVTANKVFEDFCNSDEPLVLLSPSFGTGWDFAGKRAEFQIIPKVPFKPLNSRVMKERIKRDERYGDRLAMRDLVQWCGRIQRYLGDIGATYILDGSLTYFMNRNEFLAPRNWCRSVRRIYELPERLERL